ncbi:unnamed protein product [Phaeothamnion confervicola]
MEDSKNEPSDEEEISSLSTLQLAWSPRSLVPSSEKTPAFTMPEPRCGGDIEARGMAVLDPTDEVVDATTQEALRLARLHFLVSPLPLPALNLALLVVGTSGDCQPFLILGAALRRQGHRVRIATHKEYEQEVRQHGFEYYPLGGNPRRLSQLMVEAGGRLLPLLWRSSDRRTLPEKISMLKEIIDSTWPACTEPDPADPEQRPFIADAIVSNPVTFAHVHCAEALSVPLVMMFPQ